MGHRRPVRSRRRRSCRRPARRRRRRASTSWSRPRRPCRSPRWSTAPPRTRRPFDPASRCRSSPPRNCRSRSTTAAPSSSSSTGTTRARPAATGGRGRQRTHRGRQRERRDAQARSVRVRLAERDLGRADRLDPRRGLADRPGHRPGAMVRRRDLRRRGGERLPRRVPRTSPRDDDGYRRVARPTVGQALGRGPRGRVVAPRRVPVVGDAGDRGARGRRDVASVAAGPARRRVDAGLPRREAQDRLAAHRRRHGDRASAGVMGRHRPGRHDRGGGPDRLFRPRILLHHPAPGGRLVRAEIVAVGTELLLGQIADTNARWMSEELAGAGIDVTNHQAVGDNLERIVEALRLAASRADVVLVCGGLRPPQGRNTRARAADVVLVCGGLGPTEDDITRDAIAAFAGVPLVFHAELETMLREKFRRWSAIGEMPESNLRQAFVPEGARWIVPDRGTAPGLSMRLDGTRLYAVPGVPDEMQEMVGDTIVPELRELAGGDAIVSRILRCAGMGESAVAERLADVFASSTNPTIAYLASMGEVKVRVTAKAASRAEAEALAEPFVAEVRSRLGDVVFTDDDETLEQAVLRLLGMTEHTLACAESLTGGGVGARLTAIPGSSSAFVGS